LLKKYTTDVFDNMADETAMEIVLSESWIQNPLGDLVKSVDEIIDKNTVPKLRFTAEGLEEMKEERLWMMGGNHRRLAQRIMLDQKTRDYERMMEDAKELRDKWAEGGKVDERKRKEAEELEADAEELKKQIDFESLWAVKLYSRGAQRQGGSPRGEETR
jgi:Na+/phosphate symporter